MKGKFRAARRKASAGLSTRSISITTTGSWKIQVSSITAFRWLLDLPMIDAVMVEVANPTHPFGVRGVGEVPIIPPMAAVANAIYDAVGVRMTRSADVAAEGSGRARR